MLQNLFKFDSELVLILAVDNDILLLNLGGLIGLPFLLP
jgi:hypothetical protein